MKSATEPDTLSYAREALAGKRTALIGFDEASAAELTRILTEADVFTRSVSLKVGPSANILKPFELILVNLEGATGTSWLDPQELSSAVDRCIGVGRPPMLLMLVSEARVSYRAFCVWPARSDELLLRCVLALRPGSQLGPRPLPTGSTIVLADDDPSITALVRLALQRNGMTCETASNGGDALELINRIKPCATVLDVGMPNIDGFEVLSRIRSAPEIAQTRVILLTGSEQEADVIRGFSLGADDYVTKPFNPMELMMRLKRLLGRI